MRLAVLLASAALLTSAAAAASAAGDYRITGAGAIACSQITADIASDPQAAPQIAAWLMGYSTATNRQTADTWDLMGSGGIDAYYMAVQADCVAHPDKMLETAAFDVLNANYETRTVNKP